MTLVCLPNKLIVMGSDYGLDSQCLISYNGLSVLTTVKGVFRPRNVLAVRAVVTTWIYDMASHRYSC